ncbi:MAG: hypothetical protein N3F62_07260 [Bacteroidia bacterium]|jgi:hypothetical protein|nr:hypothetical protein [Bacteroidia bacterium]
MLILSNKKLLNPNDHSNGKQPVEFISDLKKDKSPNKKETFNKNFPHRIKDITDKNLENTNDKTIKLRVAMNILFSIIIIKSFYGGKVI